MKLIYIYIVESQHSCAISQLQNSLQACLWTGALACLEMKGCYIHIFTVPSQLPVANIPPVGLNSTDQTASVLEDFVKMTKSWQTIPQFLWPWRANCISPVCWFHIFTLLSSEPEASHWLLLHTATLCTESVWPVSVNEHWISFLLLLFVTFWGVSSTCAFPSYQQLWCQCKISLPVVPCGRRDSSSHTLTDESLLLLTSVLPLGLNVTHITWWLWPLRDFNKCPVCIFQMQIAPSSKPAATSVPSLQIETELT